MQLDSVLRHSALRGPSLAAGRGDIRSAFTPEGRDFASFECRVILPGAFRADGTPDPEADLARIPALKAVGVTVVEVLPLMFCRGPDELEPFLRQAMAAVRTAA